MCKVILLPTAYTHRFVLFSFISETNTTWRALRLEEVARLMQEQKVLGHKSCSAEATVDGRVGLSE